MYEYHGNKGSRRQQEIKKPLTLYRAGGFLFISCRRYQTDHLQIYSGGVRILNVQLASSVDLSDLDAARRSYIRSLKELGSVLDRLIEGPALTDVVEREEYGRTENDR